MNSMWAPIEISNMSQANEVEIVIFEGSCGLSTPSSTTTPIGKECRDPASFLCTSILKVGPVGKEMEVNSYLLDVSSPFFNSHFNGNYESTSAKQIDLSELDYNAVLRIIRYLYTGTLIISEGVGIEILKAAKKFELQEVVWACALVVKNGIISDTCLEIMTFAVNNGLLELGLACQDFIKQHFEGVMESDSFLQLSYEALENVIHCSTKKETILNAVMRWVKHDETRRSSYLPRWVTYENMEAIYSSNRLLFHTAFAEGSVLRSDPICKDLYCKFLEIRIRELETNHTLGGIEMKSNILSETEAVHPPDVLNCKPFNESTERISKKMDSVPAQCSMPCYPKAVNAMNTYMEPVSNVNADLPSPIVNPASEFYEGDISQGLLNPILPPAHQRTEAGTTITVTVCTATASGQPGRFCGIGECTNQAVSEPVLQAPIIHSKVILYSKFKNEQKYIIQYDFETKKRKVIYRSESMDVRRLSSLVNFQERIFDIGGTPEKVKVGQQIEWFETSTSVDVFMPGNTAPSSTRNKLINSRAELGTCVCGEFVYAIGGYSKTDNTVACDIPLSERYPLNKRNGKCKWEKIQPMKFARSALGVAVLHNKIYAIGGVGAEYNDLHHVNSTNLATVEAFDTSQRENVWAEVLPLIVARAYMGVCVLNSKIYVVGGSVFTDDDERNWAPLRSVEAYDHETNTWTMCAEMNHPRRKPIVFEDDNLLYAIGGNPGDTPSMEVYSPTSNHWSLCSWPEGLSRHTFRSGFNSAIVISTNSTNK